MGDVVEQSDSGAVAPQFISTFAAAERLYGVASVSVANKIRRMAKRGDVPSKRVGTMVLVDVSKVVAK